MVTTPRSSFSLALFSPHSGPHTRSSSS
uniref:Uncharacterized protein n=1 Tax=Anguilla anguilla TaxID=7936 RepID=A0A0E9RUA7_ANGAN